MNDKDRDELLTELKTDMRWVKKGLTNHIATHSKLNLMAWGTAMTALVAVILMIIKSLA